MALPKPTLQARPSAGLSFLTDESLFAATGVRLGFSRRQGGVSEPPYDGLNLGDHVEDDPMAVAENRALLLDAAGLGSTRLLTLNQVHGDVVLALDDDAAAAWEEVARAGAAGADGLMIEVHNNPAKAKCDGAQSLTPDQFDELMGFITKEVEFFGKKMN